MRKLFLSLILSLFVFVAYAEGISNYKELLAFAKAVNKEADISMWQNDKGVVCLKADIDMKKGKKFPTIKTFKGKFDGCGHRLYNWSTKTALFGTVETEAVVENIIIDASCKLTAATSFNDKDEYVAYLVEINKGSVLNCSNYGMVEHTGNEALKKIYVGSIVACNYNIVYGCKNYAAVTSRINFTKSSKGLIFVMGGVVGASHPKSLSGATISYCENSGSVSYMGDYPNNSIGGIVGDFSKSTVKYCVNRGNVVAIGMPMSFKSKGAARAGGIASWGNSDIICCDNFGIVAASGAQESFAAGICARLNAEANMVDCVNFGKISTNSSSPAYAGGIMAQTTQSVRLSNCYNYGEIIGESLQTTSSCGGIVGALSMRKGLKTGAYIRDCVNFGKVNNKSTNKYSSTAGVLAYGAGRVDKDKPKIEITVCDCGNKGKITSAASRTGEIIGYSRYLVVRGERYDDMVKAVKPLKDGTNIFGRIVDTTGMPVEGVVVSDGEQSVKSDVNGEYMMKSDLKNVHFVMISVPAEYEIPLRGNRPQFFRRVPRYIEAARADFVLKKRDNPTDNFVLAMIGDPQTRGLKTDKATERFRDVILPDVAALKAKTGKEVYAITLGDLVYNWMFAYDHYVDVLAESPVPMVSVIGNHDYDQRTLFDTKLGTPYFESYLAPLNYSFNIGKMHFVVVNDILYNRPTDKHKYKVGLEDYTYKWLENDLKHVSKETTVVLCSHAPLFKGRNNYNEKLVNYKKYSALLSEYKNVYAWAGHTHQNYNFDYAKAPARYESLKNIKSIVVARCIGMIRLNRELNVDGTPNGYVVAEVNGDNMEWYYKTVGRERDYQMRIYSPTRTNSSYAKAIIWNYSPETWSTPEWWENGVKVADMSIVKGAEDLDYLKIYAEHNAEKLGKTERKYSKPQKIPFMFQVEPTAGTHAGEVRVTDPFGVTYTQSVKW